MLVALFQTNSNKWTLYLLFLPFACQCSQMEVWYLNQLLLFGTEEEMSHESVASESTVLSTAHHITASTVIVSSHGGASHVYIYRSY
jgi:hypothetical protein